MSWRSRLPLHLLAVLLMLLLGARTARAVELTGQLRGTIEDSEGLAVPGVTLTLRSPQMQGPRQTTTDAEGEYRFVGLPVGDYRLLAQMAGFKDQEISVRVAPGQTITADLTLSLATGTQEIVVEDRAPVVDVTTTQTGLTMSREMLRDLPNAGRDYQSAMNVAPGVVDNGSGNPNMRGGLSYGNQYYVDGVNTTDPLTSTFSMNMNFDVMEEVQVITGGMDAEFGRSMGGAVNIVTRSGGNDFEGNVQLLYSSTATQVYKPLPEEEDIEEPESASQQIALNLGGPIVKDKLWFFTGAQLDRYLFTPSLTEDIAENYPEGFEVPTRNWVSTYLFGKITWKPHADHRIWIHAQADPTNINNSTAEPYTLSNNELWWQQGGWLASVGYQWFPDAKTVVDAQVSTNYSFLQYQPMQWKDCKAYDKVGYCKDDFSEAPSEGYPYPPAWLANDPDGFNYGPYPIAYYTRRHRHSLTAAITRFVEAAGEHEIKAGLQLDILDSYDVTPGLEDGIPYYSHAGDPGDLSSYTPTQLLRYDNNGEARLGGTLVGWYIQDAWTVFDRLTLRPGLRFEKGTFQNNVETVVYNTPITVAPRMGAAFDLTEDGRTSIFAYYGRFYDPGFLSISSILSKGTSGGGYYNWDPEANGGAGDWAEEPFYSFSPTFLQHGDLKVPFSDEFSGGLYRDVGDGWSVGATFTYEESRHLFEDDEVNLIWNDRGDQLIGSRDGTDEARFRLRTPWDAFIQYTSVEFQANRQFTETWGVLASYTWSRSYGRFRNDDSETSLATAQYDVPPLRQYEVGIMPYDTPHSLKVTGSWRRPDLVPVGEDLSFGALFGARLGMDSGWPYRPQYYNQYFSDWSVVNESLDGDYRLPMYSSTDLKGGITFAAYDTTWDLTVEVFNLFNSRTVTAVQDTVDDPDGTPSVDEEGNLQFGQALARQSPRYFQFGLRGEF